MIVVSMYALQCELAAPPKGSAICANDEYLRARVDTTHNPRGNGGINFSTTLLYLSPYNTNIISQN